MKNCTDPAIGKYLHAYELHLLTVAEAEQFERHMLTCQSCFEEVRSLRPYSMALSDPNLPQQMAEAPPPDESTDAGWRERIRRTLWPDRALPLRPAFSYAAMVAVVLVLLLGIRGSEDGPPIGPVQRINLLATRLAGSKVISMGQTQGACISVSHPASVAGQVYSLVIVEESSGRLLYEGQAVFNDRGLFELYIPSERMMPGHYVVRVTGSADSEAVDILEYSFTITE
jgi:anti-sigma factor RsiW